MSCKILYGTTAVLVAFDLPNSLLQSKISELFWVKWKLLSHYWPAVRRIFCYCAWGVANKTVTKLLMPALILQDWREWHRTLKSLPMSHVRQAYCAFAVSTRSLMTCSNAWYKSFFGGLQRTRMTFCEIEVSQKVQNMFFILEKCEKNVWIHICA